MTTDMLRMTRQNAWTASS